MNIGVVVFGIVFCVLSLFIFITEIKTRKKKKLKREFKMLFGFSPPKKGKQGAFERKNYQEILLNEYIGGKISELRIEMDEGVLEQKCEELEKMIKLAKKFDFEIKNCVFFLDFDHQH